MGAGGQGLVEALHSIDGQGAAAEFFPKIQGQIPDHDREVDFDHSGISVAGSLPGSNIEAASADCCGKGTIAPQCPTRFS